MRAELAGKYDALKELLARMDSCAVAFSGGIDSALLAHVAHGVLGASMRALTLSLASTPERELVSARAFCQEHGIPQTVIELDELTLVPEFAANPPDRCYFCKKALFSAMAKEARAQQMAQLVDGSNTDDDGDWRPGMRALGELGVRSPLKEAGFAKADIRELARELGIPFWDKPSAACLSSRIPYGERITRGKLAAIEAAEDFLHGLGFEQLRVRVHGTLARIEVEATEIERLAASGVRELVDERMRELGFSYAALDLRGFRSGSMNEVLAKEDA